MGFNTKLIVYENTSALLGGNFNMLKDIWCHIFRVVNFKS